MVIKEIEVKDILTKTNLPVIMYASKRERCSYDTARFILYILQNHGRKCGSRLSTKRTWKRSSERSSPAEKRKKSCRIFPISEV